MGGGLMKSGKKGKDNISFKWFSPIRVLITPDF